MVAMAVRLGKEPLGADVGVARRVQPQAEIFGKRVAAYGPDVEGAYLVRAGGFGLRIYPDGNVELGDN
jgi:hypothetical protein